MKKIILITTLFLITLNTVFASEFKTCLREYNDAKYQTASECFYDLLKYDNENIQARFYYAASLFFDRQYDLSYQQYKYLAEKYPNTEIGKYSHQEATKVYKKIQYVKNAKANDSGNYCNDLDIKTKWYYMPIKVYIQPSQYKHTTAKAFYEWEVKTSGTVKFSLVTDEKRAQIKVYFVDKISQPLSHNNLGITHLKYIGNMNTSARIEILQRTNFNQLRTQKQVYPVILHEIGHALGISGHSKSNNDIMYENDYTNDTHLSNRDINTLKAIYK